MLYYGVNRRYVPGFWDRFLPKIVFEFEQQKFALIFVSSRLGRAFGDDTQLMTSHFLITILFESVQFVKLILQRHLHCLIMPETSFLSFFYLILWNQWIRTLPYRLQVKKLTI